MRLSKTLGAVQMVGVELESTRHTKLRLYAKSQDKTISEILRDRLVKFIDELDLEAGSITNS